MALELESLEKAIAALQAVVERSDDGKLMGGLDEVTQDAIKAGVIQHFELTYELCWKFMKRWIETNVSPTAADGVTRRELFRQAAEQNLIADVDRWMDHHKARNETLHTYDAKIAEVGATTNTATVRVHVQRSSCFHVSELQAIMDRVQAGGLP